MQTNVGKCDRVFRAVIGLAIVGVGLFYHSWWGVIGLVFVASAYTGFCMCYKMCGISTHGKGGSCCGGSPSCSMDEKKDGDKPAS